MGLRIVLILLAIISVGCAGPATPFGAIVLRQKKASEVSDKTLGLLKTRARVRFSPDRQVLHGATNFSITVEDPMGMPDDSRLMLSYNGLDVTQEFLNNSERINLDPMNHAVRFTARNLRLLPTRENKIQVQYRRSPNEMAVTARYLPPSCSPFHSNQMVLTVPEFDPPGSLVQLINQQAQRKKFNPYLVAALVAQESSFDPRAVSSKKALGLTQVTKLGESEILKRKENWPQYPGLDQMSLPFLKLAILNGKIHSGNEWRLDPALSIEGGVEYLTYLTEYWNRPDKRAQVERKLGPSENVLSEVLLASYNSGASRVSDALERDGDKWLDSSELVEAHKYVRRVVSYCDHFEHREESP